MGTEQHGDLLAGCIFSVVQLVVGSPRYGFLAMSCINGLMSQVANWPLRQLQTVLPYCILWLYL